MLTIQLKDMKTKKEVANFCSQPLSLLSGGADETRTRDPMRDRHVF